MQYRKLPFHVKLTDLNTTLWSCLTNKVAFNAPNFNNCLEWPQEIGCPMLTNYAPPPRPAGVRTKEGGMHLNQEDSSAESDEDTDSLDGIFDELKEYNRVKSYDEDENSDNETIVEQRYQEAQRKYKSNVSDNDSDNNDY
jgi:hypothetical protein